MKPRENAKIKMLSTDEHNHIILKNGYIAFYYTDMVELADDLVLEFIGTNYQDAKVQKMINALIYRIETKTYAAS